MKFCLICQAPLKNTNRHKSQRSQACYKHGATLFHMNKKGMMKVIAREYQESQLGVWDYPSEVL